MKQDIGILSSIVIFFVLVLIMAYATPDQLTHSTCVVSNHAQNEMVHDDGSKTTYMLMDVKVMRTTDFVSTEPLVESVLLMTPPLLEGQPLWTQNIKFDAYKTGEPFDCDVHLWRVSGYRTISEFDRVPNVSTGIHQRDRAYNGIMSVVRGVSFIAASAYLIILVNILYGVPIISGLNLLYHKTEEGERLGDQPTTTI
jgi:hypothetical protein